MFKPFESIVFIMVCTCDVPVGYPLSPRKASFVVAALTVIVEVNIAVGMRSIVIKKL